MKRTKLRRKSKSETAKIKDNIQVLLRQIVMKRDGGCILRERRSNHDDVLQADHLITRANSATYGDSRLVVCVCRACHGWKHWHKEQYDASVRQILSPERVKLWDMAIIESFKAHKMDWKLVEIGLKQELSTFD